MIPPNNKGRKLSKVNALAFAYLVKYLNEACYSCAELAEMTGLHYVTVLDHTRTMHKVGALHICAWHPDSRGRHLIKIYAIGERRDAKRPKKTPAERQAAYRTKQQQIDITRRLHGQEP